MIVGLYAALSAFFLIFLSFRVIGMRRQHRVSVGSGDNPHLERAIRVHANFVEYTPLTLILLAVAEMQGLPVWAVHLFGITLVAARLTHFVGFRSAEAPGQFRVIGMVTTFGLLGVLGAIVIMQLIL